MTEETPKLIEGVDYYLDENGRLVFTGTYLLKRGYCCDQGCRHCPYKNKKAAEQNKIKPE